MKFFTISTHVMFDSKWLCLYCFLVGWLIQDDLAGCQEIVLNGENSKTPTFSIESLKNNLACDDEILRMNFFAVGFDFYIYFKTSQNDPQKYFAYINGHNREFCKLQLHKNGLFAEDLQIINCKNLTNGKIEFFKDGKCDPFFYGTFTNWEYVTHLKFGRYEKETEDTRYFLIVLINVHKM
uniref:Uncharacterized protein n=1 Tax=Megaselia scalaris TaxID=36166 RepID=T1H4J5_MEGSC